MTQLAFALEIVVGPQCGFAAIDSANANVLSETVKVAAIQAR